MKPHRLSIIGTGYVGLCTAVGFASKGYKVIASTHSREKATSIIGVSRPSTNLTYKAQLCRTVVQQVHKRLV